jgi:hypothetical protein
MSEQYANVEKLSPNLRSQILKAFQHFESEPGELVVANEATRRGGRLYVPVRSVNTPPTMFSFYHALAGAEVELRDSGLDIELTPEYRQQFVVVAHVQGHETPFIYVSEEGNEYDELAKLLERDRRGGMNPRPSKVIPSMDPKTATLRGQRP